MLKLFFFSFLYFLSLIIDTQSQNTKITARKIKSVCDKNLYKIIINIGLSNELDKVLSFNLNITSSKPLLFKCVVDPYIYKIICITNLEQQHLDLSVDDYILMPYPFPQVEGIIWEYNSFLRLIYRTIIKIKKYCGLYFLNEKMTRNEFENR